MSIIPDMTGFFRIFDSYLGYIYQMDVVFGILIVVIAGLIGFYSNRIYKFTRKRKYLLFSLSFLFIALGYAVKTGFDLLIQVESSYRNIFFSIADVPLVQKFSILLYMILILMGYIIMIVIAMDGNRKTALLFLMLLAVSLVISTNYFLTFNLTVIILLLFLVYHFYMNFSRSRKLSSGVVWYGFLLILVSHLVALFIVFSNKFYLLSNAFHMLGFLLLLLNFILVFRK